MAETCTDPSGFDYGWYFLCWVEIEIILSLYNLTVKQLRKGSKSSAIYWIKEIVIIARMVPIVKALLVFSINLISPRLPVCEVRARFGHSIFLVYYS